jgi:hypothetical protein
VHPGAWDLPNDGIDQDCDGADAIDTDGNGWTDDMDCDPDDPDVHPLAVEACNGIDDDCDGEVDEGACGPDTGDTGHPVDVEGTGCGCHGCRGGSSWLILPLLGLVPVRRRRLGRWPG